MYCTSSPLIQSFDIVARGSTNARMTRLLTDIRSDVETGTSLSAAFRKHPLYFDALYCNLVEAGEAGGILEALLVRLAVYQEKTMAIKNKIKSALIYPVAVLVVAFVVLAVIMILRFHLSVDWWTSPLMILGTQWYILFNVIAGASAMPKELRDASDNFGVSGWLWWKKVALPCVFPFYVTGAITASGGSWNASIVAEVASWGSKTLHAHGLGGYIADAVTAGDFRRVVLGTAVMSFFVVVLNRIIWRPLYWLAERKYRLT